MLHVELHSAHGLSAPAASYFSDNQPCEPTDAVMEALTKEMENMIVEHQLRTDTPLRTLWDTVVARQRDSATKVSSRLQSPSPSDNGTDDEEIANDGYLGTDRGVQSAHEIQPRRFSPASIANARLPSPPKSLSPETRFINLAQAQSINGRSILATDEEDCKKDGANLPSPRPSPPPSDIRSRSNSPNKRDSMPRSGTPREDIIH